MEFTEMLKTYQKRVEVALQSWLPDENQIPTSLHQAMRYATLDGGKRVRPILVYTTGQALGVTLGQLDGPACAVELIHASSLVHDDLPGMDNDMLRRGKPTCHIAFGEPTALLTGDALPSLAFEVLANDKMMKTDPIIRLKMITELARANGSPGIAGGQVLDMEAEGKQITLEQLQTLHSKKTGALILASVRLGALSCTTISDSQKQALDNYAKAIGLAFQVRDDILNVETNSKILGKPNGSDQARGKSTYVSLFGLEESKNKAQELYKKALEELSGLGMELEPLRQLSAFIVERNN
ncbi:MAG: (2E,6E)-farnesyl diphosphate synthase [Candidatus Magasanikbacteria bacterium CG10_big_fil_rev_8_21_14_0_10_36_16]|uniref:(2E,6E)-farnesyl diphosphate synthase n=1 Tax=Candidatus Magasanikbacteria bacterium CG10_big_fil_rev_8_21_14_0_10_36_16 TaxID=1974645 RepID=A0A2H0TZJ2_9BACT|nr:MAG: (2E,6E)-farnesyl diphosphate synthase [Candidatus Magasanikbacteria bacterium CG10_big_fil_rev_8_21_14_0_10_36_16]